MQEWAAQLKYLQSILLEFDVEWASVKGKMICYFRKDLKLSVRAEIELRGQELNNFEELMQKAVNVEAKAVFWPCSYICNTNQYCLWDSFPAHFTTAKILPQGYQINDPRVKELKKP